MIGSLCMKCDSPCCVIQFDSTGSTSALERAKWTILHLPRFFLVDGFGLINSGTKATQHVQDWLTAGLHVPGLAGLSWYRLGDIDMLRSTATPKL